MPRRTNLITLAVAALVTPAFGDETLYRYEGDVLPYGASAGWEVFDPCDPPCTEFVEDGHFVFFWPVGGDLVNYTYVITQPPDAPPPHAVGRVALPLQPSYRPGPHQL